MVQLFARVELRGNPNADIYQRLHEYMRSRYWFNTITGSATSTLPHGTYQAQYTVAVDLAGVAMDLKNGIESTVWTKALILVIQSANWAETAG